MHVRVTFKLAQAHRLCAAIARTLKSTHSLKIIVCKVSCVLIKTITIIKTITKSCAAIARTHDTLHTYILHT